MADLSERRHPEQRGDDYRSRTARDRDRVLYCSAFRRLTGVTQVVSADETLLFHNRMTHTLKVAQIARRLAESLIDRSANDLAGGPGIDPDAAEAAALAHDLGHPPFGHIAEYELRDLCDAAGLNGYEGNAQTFRIATRLSWRDEDPGLNLTRRTLLAILKYPWLRTGEKAGAKKWGAYESERSDFEFATGSSEPHSEQSLEANIMDWADDITYAVHDLEDFYRAGLTPLDRLQSSSGDEMNKFLTRATRTLSDEPRFDEDMGREVVLDLFHNQLPFDRPYDGSNATRRKVHQSSSALITRFIAGTRVEPDGNRIYIPEEIWHEVNMLKQLTWIYVINSPDLASIQEGQKRIIRGLFEKLHKWALAEPNRDRLPTRLREIIKAVRRDADARTTLSTDELVFGRSVADYVASLTEAQAVELYGRLFGLTRSSVLHGWVRA
jgi:dGTPase